MQRTSVILWATGAIAAVLLAIAWLDLKQTRDALAMDVRESRERAGKLSADLEALRQSNARAEAGANALRTEFAVAKARLEAATARADRLEQDMTQARGSLSAYEVTVRALAGEVAALRQDLEASRASNATPEAVAAYKETIAALERELASARKGAAATNAPGASTAVFVTGGQRATVLSVGPGNSFVVVDFGANRGATAGQTLQVNRGAEILASVQLSDVRPDLSIAQVVPDSLRGVLQKGDSAVLLR